MSYNNTTTPEQKVNVDLYLGDCLHTLRKLTDCSVDSIVTDPPYGLSKQQDMAEVLRHWLAGDDYTHNGGGFMGKSWDSFVPGPSIWRECLRVLKPGGHLLAFAGTRTMDLMGLSLRLAGFELRDSIGYAHDDEDSDGSPLLAWVYGSGFPKSLNVHKATGDDRHAGLGTALKPAWEPILIARKPLIGTVAENVQNFGTGAINVDGCRVEGRERTNYGLANSARSAGNTYGKPSESADFDASKGRWPANLVHDGSEAATEGLGHASRFFYCAKASKRDRDEGCENMPSTSAADMVGRDEGSDGMNSPRSGAGRASGARNFHPTVKPTELMRWLVRLVTPPSGVVLDPFTGSGSTGKAAVMEGFNFIGCELSGDYMRIAVARIGHAMIFGKPHVFLTSCEGQK